RRARSSGRSRRPRGGRHRGRRGAPGARAGTRSARSGRRKPSARRGCGGGGRCLRWMGGACTTKDGDGEDERKGADPASWRFEGGSPRAWAGPAGVGGWADSGVMSGTQNTIGEAMVVSYPELLKLILEMSVSWGRLTEAHVSGSRR